jgi:hypothetical protein
VQKSHIVMFAFGVWCLAAAGCSDDTKTQPKPDARVDGKVEASVADLAAEKPSAHEASVDQASGDSTAAVTAWIALIRGTLYTTDMDAAKTAHDAIAGAGESQAKTAGNSHHDPLLSTTDLGGTANKFGSLDRWTNSAGMALYDDASFKAAFATLFSGAPTVEKFAQRSDWTGWGDLDAADTSTPHYYVVVRGTLNFSDIASAKTAHDKVAASAATIAKAAGDVGHVVYTGTSDWKEFLAIDVWNDSTNISTVYGDASFQKAFGALFTSTPTLTVYKSTDWLGW